MPKRSTGSPHGSRASIAAGLFNALVIPSLAVAIPAVPEPIGKFDDEFLPVLEELGTRFTFVPPSRFTLELGAQASLIVYVGCAAKTLKIDGIPYLEWDIAPARLDPKHAARVVRDSIVRSVEGLLRNRGWLREEWARSRR